MAEKKHDDLSMQIQKVIDDYVIAHRRYYCSLLWATPSEDVALAYDAEAIGDFITDAEIDANIPDEMSAAFTCSFNNSLNAHLNEEYTDILNDAAVQALTDAFRDYKIDVKH